MVSAVNGSSAKQYYNPPLVVIVGPTASGKSHLAMQVARQLKGEIICADSRTVYKGMDIGTAKPSPADQRAVPHHLLDIVEPGERFSAATFKQLANQAIAKIWKRQHLPVMVGGTGLYIDSVLYDYEFGTDADMRLRQELAQKTIDQFIEYCKENNIELPGDVKNKRRLVRAIEQQGINRKRSSTLRTNTLVVGISIDKETLRLRITHRAQQMFASGVVEEALHLASIHGWDSEAMTGSIYKIIRQLTNGDISRNQAVERFITSDMQLAKRQKTWFRRNPDIIWSDDRSKLLHKVVNFAKQYPY